MTNGFDRELVIKLATLFVVSVLPSLIYLIIVEKLNRRWRSRLRRVRMSNSHRDRLLVKRYIGDARCQYNALSPHIRCAVNPYGPCKGCSYYQEK